MNSLVLLHGIIISILFADLLVRFLLVLDRPDLDLYIALQMLPDQTLSLLSRSGRDPCVSNEFTACFHQLSLLWSVSQGRLRMARRTENDIFQSLHASFHHLISLLEELLGLGYEGSNQILWHKMTPHGTARVIYTISQETCFTSLSRDSSSETHLLSL
jgi:hypothetical protein